MINIQKDTPVEYSKQSRDYQVFSFLYTLLFNQPKMFTELLSPRAYTLNFIPKYEWNNDDFLGVTNNFKYLMRGKGTTGAIESALRILARIKGLSSVGIKAEQGDEPGTIRLILSEEIANVSNIEDLFRYIFPAGCVYEIVKFSRYDSNAKLDIVAEDSVKINNPTTYAIHDLHIPDSEGYAIPLCTNSEGLSINYITGMIVTDGYDSEGGN